MAAKWVGGLGAPSPDKLLVGVILSGRGEFAYIVASNLASIYADSARTQPLLDPSAYAVVIWSLALSTFLTPFLFRLFLTLRGRRAGLSVPTDPGSLTSQLHLNVDATVTSAVHVPTTVSGTANITDASTRLSLSAGDHDHEEDTAAHNAAGEEAEDAVMWRSTEQQRTASQEDSEFSAPVEWPDGATCTHAHRHGDMRMHVAVNSERSSSSTSLPRLGMPSPTSATADPLRGALQALDSRSDELHHTSAHRRISSDVGARAGGASSNSDGRSLP